jgi:transposase-like protein
VKPREQFCRNKACRAYGRQGEGHVVVHSQKERRYQCKRCSRTFSATKGTALYRAHKPPELVATVVTLLAYGCPPQAIVAAFGLDERAIARWQRESGRQRRRRVHEHIVRAGGVLLAQVQADELRVRVVGGVMWLASALSVSSRLWLGGAVRVRRDRGLIRTLLEGVRACGAFDALLLCTDGLAACPKQALKVLREPLRTGKRGRPRLLLPDGVTVAQVIKRYAKRRVVGVLRRVVRGTEAEEVGTRLRSTQGGTTAVINTAYIERLQATFRSRLAPPLGRGTRGRRRVSGGASEGDAGGGHVVGGHRVRLLPGAPLSAPAGRRCCRGAAMGREDPGPGRGAYRSPLVARRAAGLCRSSGCSA